MEPTTPVLPSHPMLYPEVVLAKDQPPYKPLVVVQPTYSCGTKSTISHYKLTLRERLKLLWTGSLWLEQLHFGQPLQPQRPTVHEPLTEKDAA